MKVFKPLQASLLHKTFEFKGNKQLAVSVLFGFPFDGSEPMLEPDMWRFIASELGTGGIFDMGMPKPNGEVLLHGKYFAPNGIPVTADSVRLKIGKIDKVLLVHGNRYWRVLLGPTEPEPIREMPLDYSNAFGGTGYAKNPIGKGMVDVDVFGEMRLPLPNIEYPDQIMTSSGQKPDPAGFGPLDMAWEFRTSKLGTYDDNWLRERWPAYPDDLNWNHFNAASSDQWLDEYFSGTETFDLYNMHPDKPVVKGQLPSFRTRCFIKRASFGDGEIDEIKMRAETVWLFPHAETGIVLYRGVIGIQMDNASDVQNIIIGYENISDPPRESTHYAKSLESRQAGERMLNTVDLIPIGATCGFGAVEEPKSSPDSDSDGNDGRNSKGTTKTPAESKRAALIELSDKLAEIPGTDAARAKVGEEIIETYLPPLFPRPPGHEQINELLSDIERAEKLKVVIQQQGGDESDIQNVDIEETRSKIEQAGIEMKEGYRAQAHMLEEGRPKHEKHHEILYKVLLERLKNKESVAGWDFAGLNLSNQNLSGIDFNGCYLEKVDLTDSKLTGANLEGAILAFANLSRCDLSGANLKRANLGAANLMHAVFDGADLTEAILARTLLTGAKLTNCNLTDIDLLEAELGDVDMSGSTLPKAQFIDLYMSRAKFHRTILTGSTFTNCSLNESDFSEATLDESTWVESMVDDANFSSAKMTNNRFPSGTSLRRARFTHAMLDSSNFRETDLRNADFTEASLNMCDFGDSDARQARFTRSIAKGGMFMGTDLGEADLSSMNLMGGTLMKSRLTNATLRNANCYGVEFLNAIVGGTDFSGAILYQTKLEHWRPS